MHLYYPELRWNWKNINTDKIKFDSEFMWGTATAAHQVEGNCTNNWSEFEKNKLFDPNKIKGLIDKQSEELGQVKKKTKGITQSEDRTMLDIDKLTMSQTLAVKSQYYACWAVPAGMPLNDDFLLTVKLNLKKTGEYEKIDVLERERMGIDKRFKAFADSVIRAIRLCNPIKKLPSG